MLDNGVYSQANEAFVLNVRDLLIHSALEQGYDVIVDDTNLNPRQVEHLQKLVAPLAACRIQDFTHVPLHVCIERDSQRSQPVGAEVIRSMYARFLAERQEPEKE
jgi:tRNA uridine 5-carbamoylmethylation protein Kti12